MMVAQIPITYEQYGKKNYPYIRLKGHTLCKAGIQTGKHNLVDFSSEKLSEVEPVDMKNLRNKQPNVN